MGLVRRSLAFSAAERYASVVISMLSTAVLARLLTPQEFGVYAVLSALTAVASASFQEFGGANYLIQKTKLGEKDIRTAFTITFCMSVAFAVALFESRNIAARFFEQDGMRRGIAVLDLVFVLSPFSITLASLLRRDMAFGTLARGNFGANIVNASASVILAAAGFSYMAPVWGVVLGNLALAVILWASRPGFRVFRPCFAGSLEVFRFGAYSSAVVIINVFYQSFPQFILGRVLGFNAVGLFGRSVSITQLFDRLVLQVLNPVIMPAIFAQTRAGGDLKRIYLTSIELIAAVQWPFLLFLALMADPIIAVWLGPTWASIVPLVRCLCLASLSLFAACLTYPVLVAVGRVRDTLTSSLISLPPSLLIIVLASSHGVQAVAASTLVTCPLQAAVSICFVAHRLSLRPSDILRALSRSALVSACAAVGPFAAVASAHLDAGARPLGPYALLGAGVAAVGGWLVGIVLTGHPLMDQIRLIAGSLSAAWRHRVIGLRRGPVQPEGRSP